MAVTQSPPHRHTAIPLHSKFKQDSAPGFARRVHSPTGSSIRSSDSAIEEFMIGIIGKKLGMTQLFNDAGQQIPCTVIEAEPNSVLAVTSTSMLKAVQLGGLGVQRTARENAKGEHTPRGRRATKAELGHAKKAGLESAP